MSTTKIVKLSHATLTPALLHGTRDAIATEGKVHASAFPVIRIDGKEYASTEENQSADVLISRPAIAKAAAALWDMIGQALADDAGCVVEYSVNGETRSYTPAAK